MTPSQTTRLHGTTVLGVLHDGKIALGSDGQATLGNTVMKHKAQKVPHSGARADRRAASRLEMRRD